MQLHVITLKKHYGINTAGETIGVSTEAAAHIKKHDGGEDHGTYDNATHTVELVKKDGVVTGIKATAKKQ